MIIYFDLDGVLANFNKMADKVQKERASNKPFKDCTEEEKSLIVEFWKKVEKIGSSFWEDMEIIDGMKEVIFSLKQRGFKLGILSSLPKSGSVIAGLGKAKWITKNFSNCFDVINITTKTKTDFVEKDAILIDDRTSNCLEWERAGGISIIFKDAKDLQKTLDEIFQKE